MQLIYRILYLCNTNSIYSPLLFAVHTIQYTFYTKLHKSILKYISYTRIRSHQPHVDPTPSIGDLPSDGVLQPDDLRKVGLASHDSHIGLRAFAPHDLYLLPSYNHGPCLTWLGMGQG